ncbi:MAG: enoyl-CoA hydratase-related protein [Christensenella sp.]|nr:enoyl-CoA hydratase-related protein [Christensenella sp.]
MKNVLFSVQNGIGYLTVNRPRALNALNTETLKEIGALADKIAQDETIQTVIVRGAGTRAFVAGADISEMQDMDEKEGRRISEFAQSVFCKIKNLPQIVIAAVNGYALGGGNELVMACDIRIASSRARFGQPEVNLGILPGFGGTQRLSRIVGKGHAKEIIFSAEQISAQEAYRIGLVNRVVPPEALMRTARDLAMKIMSKGMVAVRKAKQAINEGVEVDLEKGLAIEADKWTECFATNDQKEGMTAFLEKRKPSFRNF